MMTGDVTTDNATCGRCGVYRRLHPWKNCQKSRYSFWWDRHLLRRHLFLRLWLAVPTKLRWKFGWWWTNQWDLDWCEMVDVLLAADRWHEDKDDYDCPCDMSYPFGCGPPRYGECYCVPPEGWVG